MKRILTGSALAAAVGAFALAPGAGASDPDGCYAGVGQSPSCTWTADAPGAYGVASNGWKVEQQTDTDPISGAPIWTTIDSGTVPTASTPGRLIKSQTYRLTVSGSGGGAIGNISGGRGPA
jgi:hypothetical protein